MYSNRDPGFVQLYTKILLSSNDIIHHWILSNSIFAVDQYGSCVVTMRKKSIQQTGMHTERYDRAIVNCRIMIAVFLLAALLFVGGSTAATYSGSCGDNLTWTLDTDTGVLEIEGTGKMTNYISGDPGWYQYRDNITSVSLSSGVTSIGQSAFSGCRCLTSIEIPDSVTSIGDYAFVGCTNLTYVTIGNNVTSIGKGTFGNCHNIQVVDLSRTNAIYSVRKDAFGNNNSAIKSDSVIYVSDENAAALFKSGRIKGLK